MALSAREAFAPRTAARAYGVPLADGTDSTSYLEVKANRDFVLAGLLVVAASASQSILSIALFVGTIAPVADAWIVKRHGKASATIVHLSTAAYLIVTGAVAASGH